jgi:hypothetical protein
MIELEVLLARLARVPNPVLADRLLASALAASPCLLGPAQQALDRLRGDAGTARDVEHVQGGWWRVGGELMRVTEAAGATDAQGVPDAPPRARLHLAGLQGVHPLWVDPTIHVPAPLLGVAWEAAHVAPLAIARPGRLTVGPYVLGFGPGDGGRTVRGVQLHGAGPPVGGTVVEVAPGEPLEILAHELVHAMGSTCEAQAARLGGLLARAVARAGR